MAARKKPKNARVRYAAFLRGVSPLNAKMPELRRCFEAAGWDDVRTVLASGNLVFSAPSATPAALEREAEAAMSETLGRTFLTIIRPIEALRRLLAADLHRRFRLPPAAKRVVTFLRAAPRPGALALPLEKDGARILAVKGREIYTAYVPSPRGAAFMVLIEKTFGQAVTTRTWETIQKVVQAAEAAKP